MSTMGEGVSQKWTLGGGQKWQEKWGRLLWMAP